MVRPLKPVKLRSGQSGFTLIEVLIVAAIMLTVFPIVFQKAAEIRDQQALDQFVSSLQETLYFAQMSAMAEQRFIQVDFGDKEREVTVAFDTFHQLRTLAIGKGIHIRNGSHQLIVNFTPRGTVSRAGSIYILSKYHKYKLVFLLGQGRFYVESV